MLATRLANTAENLEMMTGTVKAWMVGLLGGELYAPPGQLSRLAKRFEQDMAVPARRNRVVESGGLAPRTGSYQPRIKSKEDDHELSNPWPAGRRLPAPVRTV